MSINLDKMHIQMSKPTSIILDVSRKKKKADFDHVAYAKWLKLSRENKRPSMNQSDLAKAVGVVRQRISELEGGDNPILPKLPSRPGLDLAESIGEALNIDINEARLKAGYNLFKINNFTNTNYSSGNSKEAGNLIEIEIGDINEEERQKILGIMKVVVAGIKAESNTRISDKPDGEPLDDKKNVKLLAESLKSREQKQLPANIESSTKTSSNK